MPTENMMDSLLNDLTKILLREQEVYTRYLGLLSEQQEYLVANDLDGIKGTVEKINAFAEEASNLENGRRRVLGKISKLGGIKTGEMNITGLLERLGSSRLEDLEKIREQFLAIQRKISEQRTRNELLIEQSMKMISHSMQLIHHVTNPKATYEDPSKIRGNAGMQAALISRMM
jgi:hypothetical protein